MRLFDTHCHLYDEQYKDDLEEVINKAKESNVKLMMLPADSLKASYKTSELSKKYDCFYAEVGIHPSEVYQEELDKTLIELEKLVLSNPKIKAIGEIGLDYYWYKETSQKEVQKMWFIKQIELANKLHLPIVVHSRDAYEDTINILNEYEPLYGCVFHCFSYSVECLKTIIKKEYYIGLDGPVTYKNAIKPKEIAKIVPLDRLLLETDCPYLSPVPYRGKRNEPANLTYIACEISRLKEITFDELVEQCYINGCKFFGIDYE